nr:keratinocyte proline-rich protein-like isoform X1 [Anas platyrhynchos]
MGAGCAAPLLQKGAVPQTRVTSLPCRDPAVAASCASSTTSPPGAAGRSPTAAAGATPTTSGRGQQCHQACLGHEKPKPGECPAGLPGLLGPCQEECGGDSDCPGSQKCCNSSCGNQCLPPAPARKAGFCPASAGLFPSYDCREWCQRDADCPGEEKCCLRGCDSVCLRPAREKPGICPLTEAAPWTQAPCQASCAEDGQCPGDEKCCSSRRCGRVCLAPERGEGTATGPGAGPRLCPAPAALGEPGPSSDLPRARCVGLRPSEGPHGAGTATPVARSPWESFPWLRCPLPTSLSDKPGQCPKVRPRQAPEPCTEEDACGHDRDCPRQEKCCFGGCAMRCTRPAREHPGECPRAEPCGDPRHRHRSQCLDDSACRRDEKCCSSGCAWACVAVAVPGESQDGAPGQCVQECDTDLQCPQGQRCTSTGCGRVCGDVPGDAA